MNRKQLETLLLVNRMNVKAFKEEIMSKRKKLAIVNLLISGFFAYMITMFFAGGTIAENYTDDPIVAPEFFVILVIWAIGGLFVLVQFFKDIRLYFILSLIITWASIPIGVKIGFGLAT
jgi:hypothetical protein